MAAGRDHIEVRGIRLAEAELNDELLLAGLGGRIKTNQEMATGLARLECEAFLRKSLSSTPRENWPKVEEICELAMGEIKGLTKTTFNNVWSKVAPEFGGAKRGPKPKSAPPII